MDAAYGDVPLKRIRLSGPQEALLLGAEVVDRRGEQLELRDAQLRTADVLVDYALCEYGRRGGENLLAVTDRGQRFAKRLSGYVTP